VTDSAKLDKIIADLNDVQRKIDVHAEAHKAADETFHQLQKSVWGNGKPGLSDRVLKLEGRPCPGWPLVVGTVAGVGTVCLTVLKLAGKI
jgi:hypothetical protein